MTLLLHKLSSSAGRRVSARPRRALFLAATALTICGAGLLFAEELPSPNSSGIFDPDAGISPISAPAASVGSSVDHVAPGNPWDLLSRATDFRVVGGKLYVASFAAVGRIALGHKDYGIELQLPYADDWKFSTDASFPVEAHSLGLGMTVTVKVEQGKGGLAACHAATRRRVLEELGNQPLDHERVSLEEPALWRYEAQPEPLAKQGLRQFNLWTFKVANGACYKYRMAIITDHSGQRDLFINRVIQYVATFELGLRDRVFKHRDAAPHPSSTHETPATP